jgi:hypothetical protein
MSDEKEGLEPKVDGIVATSKIATEIKSKTGCQVRQLTVHSTQHRTPHIATL